MQTRQDQKVWIVGQKNAVVNNNIIKLIQIQLQIGTSNQLVEPKAQKFVHVTIFI